MTDLDVEQEILRRKFEILGKKKHLHKAQMWDVIKSEGRLYEIKTTHRQLLETAILNDLVGPQRILLTGEADHLRRDIQAGRGESQFLQESG